MTERTELLARVAHLYYEDSLTQDEIARRVGTSRSTVSRMVQEAREAGVVEIVVHYPWKTVPELEETLRSLLDGGIVVHAEVTDPSTGLRTSRWQATREVDDIPIPDTLHGR